MKEQSSPNPLELAMVCPACSLTANCVHAMRYGQVRAYTFLCQCGALIFIGEAPVTGGITKQSSPGVDIHLGTILMPSVGKILKLNHHLTDSPSLS